MSTDRIVMRIAALVLGGIVGGIGATPAAWADAPVLTRPLSDWLGAQGQCPTPAGFSANYVSWTGRDQPNGDVDRIATMDYAGVDARYIADHGGTAPATRFSGAVVERTLADGRTDVRVKVVARSALSYANAYDSSTGTGALLFGATAADVLAGADPALGNASFEAEYVVDRALGGPMEDLLAGIFLPPCPVDAYPIAVDLRFLAFAGNADGQCVDDSASLLSVTQTGLVAAAIHNQFRGALGDAFPAEWVELRPECSE